MESTAISLVVPHSQGVQVAWRDAPFTGKVHRSSLPQGLTCAEIVATVPDIDVRRFLEVGTLCINGDPIPREMWPHVRPKSRSDVIVTMHLPIRGGGGGGKDAIRMVAAIALLAVTAAITGGLAAVPGTSWFAAGSLSAQVLAGAVTVGGALLLGAFVKPPSQRIAAGDSSESETSTIQASLQGNVLRRGAPTPRVVGTMRVFPPFLCQPLVEVASNYQEVIEGVYGLAGPHKIEELKFGGTALDEIDEGDIEVQIFEGLDGDADPTLFSRYGKTATPNIALSKPAIFIDTPTSSSRDWLADQEDPESSLQYPHRFVVRGRGYDEVWVTIQFPGGLNYFADGFNLSWSYGLPFRIRVRELGTTTWYNMPEIHVTDRRTNLFTRMFKFKWTAGPVKNVAPPVNKGWVAAYRSVPTQTLTPSGQGGWTSEAHFSTGTGFDYLLPDVVGASGLQNILLTETAAEFFLDGLIPKGPIEIEITRGQVYPVERFTYTSYTINRNPPTSGSGVINLFGWFEENGNDVTLLTQGGLTDTAVVARIAQVWNKPPVAIKNEFATIYIRARGVSLDALSIKASGYVPDWDGSAWSGLVTTSNPAPHYRDVLTGKLNAEPIPASMIDDDELVSWRQRCIDQGFTCDAVFEGLSASRVAEVISSCGYARPRQSEKWDVAQDRDFSQVLPAQVFTPRNMRGFRWEKAFIRKRPDGFRVSFNDVEEDYTERAIIVPRPGITAAQAGVLEEIRYDGLINENKVVAKATYDQLQSVSRFTFYSGTVDAEILVCRRGDLVLVQHDILDNQAGFARIIRAQFNQFDQLVGLYLDSSVQGGSTFFTVPTSFFTVPTAFFSSNIGVSIRLTNGAIATFEAIVSGPDDNFLIPVQPLGGLQDLIERDCLVTTGRLQRTSRRLLVYDIRPRTDLTADIVFVDEAPELARYSSPVPAEVDLLLWDDLEQLDWDDSEDMAW